MVQTVKTIEQDKRDRAREEALARLVALLERDNPHPHAALLRREQSKPNPLSQLARLQAAHAAYSLANTSDMERASTGAYFRNRVHHE